MELWPKDDPRQEFTSKSEPMSGKAKIGYLVPQFPGQTHIFFWREIAELEARGVEPVLLSTRPPPAGLIAHSWTSKAMARTTYLGKLSLSEMALALPFLPWREIMAEAGRDGRAVLKDALICAGAARALCREAREQGFRHVHVHSCGRAAMIAAFAKHMGGPSYSITLHGPLQDYGVAQPFKWRHASFATIITQKLIEEMQRDQPNDLPPRIVQRPMGVDTDHFQRELPYEPVQPDAPLRIFSCGRLNVVKGHQDLIEAVHILRKQGRDVHLEIAGEDDAGGSGFHHDLDAIIDEKGLGKYVTLLGAVDADVVKARLLDAHIFALASWHEPLGVVYMEAISCGVPTIGTRAGGVPELIMNGYEGLLVPPKSPEDIAQAIARIADTPDLARQLSETGRERMVREFSAHLGAETIIEETARALA